MSRKKQKIKIKDIEVDYYVEYRKVKYIRYELRNASLLLILPKNSKVDIEETIHKKDKWIYRKITDYYRKKEELLNLTSGMTLFDRSMSELKLLVFEYIDRYERLLGVKVNRVQFRDTVYKWGSCSSLGNVTFSKNLRYLPDVLVAYLVYHELTHLIVLAHNDKFFDIIKKEFPDYLDYDEDLRKYYYLIENEKIE